jgi:SdrD B-like domain
VISSIVIVSSQNGVNYSFGDAQPVVLGGTVYLDTNANGVKDTGETGIAGVTLTLSGTNCFGQTVTSTAITVANGAYNFTLDSNNIALLPGTYQVTETVPSGEVAIAANVGTVNNNTDGTATSATLISSIAINSGQAGLNYNFGDTVPVALGGTVYLDTNGNGVQNTGETGIAGVTLTLSGTNNLGHAITATTTTGSSGAYNFTTASNGSSLLPGTYTITEAVPNGDVATASIVGTVNGSTDGTATSATVISSIALTAGQGGINYNFGVAQQSGVSGYVYYDADGDQVFDSGNYGIADQTVFLTGTDIHGNSVNLSTTTDANGYYSFSGLTAGTYSISVEAPDGMDYNPEAVNVGTVNTVTVGTPDTITNLAINQIVLHLGDIGINYDFGFSQGSNPV